MTLYELSCHFSVSYSLTVSFLALVMFSSVDRGASRGHGTLHKHHQRQCRCRPLLLPDCHARRAVVFVSFCALRPPFAPQLPTSLPGGMSARFRIGTSLATACKDLGYAQELGYNNFLYPNESDVRSLLMWLVEKLPKESSGAGNEDEVVGSNLLYRRGVASVIGRQLAAQWAPSFCLRNGMYWRNGEGEAWHVQSTGTFHHLQAWPVTVPAEVRKAANYKPSTGKLRVSRWESAL